MMLVILLGTIDGETEQVPSTTGAVGAEFVSRQLKGVSILQGLRKE